MYHIKPDVRARRSAALLCEGLAELLERKAYPEISIAEVCAACGVARSTFYRLFDTLDDLLLYQFDSLLEKGIREYQCTQAGSSSYAQLLLKTACSDPPLLSALVKSGRTDLFDISARTKEDTLLRTLRLSLSPLDQQYCTPMLNALAEAVLRTWVSTGCRESADELYEMLRRNTRRIADSL